MVHLPYHLLLCSLALLPYCSSNTSVVDSKTVRLTTEKLIQDFPVLDFNKGHSQEDQQNFSSDLYLNRTKDGDKGMDVVYSGVNAFIRALGKPFPHKELFQDGDLMDEKKLLTSFERNCMKWVEYDQWFLVVGGECLSLAALFTALYLLYQLCRCCCLMCRRCGSDSEKNNFKEDGRFDSCRRKACTGVMAVLVVVNILAVSCLFITNEYAHRGSRELPNRIKQSIDDVTLYRAATGRSVRQLLVKDFETLNETVMEAIDRTSVVLVRELKRFSGADALDRLVSISERAAEMDQLFSDFESQLKDLDLEVNRLKNNLTRLSSHATKQIDKCLQSTVNQYKAFCEQAKQILEGYSSLPDRVSSLNNFDQVRRDLSRVMAYNVSGMFSDAVDQFQGLEQRIQSEIIARKAAVVNKVKEIADELFIASERATEALNRVDVSEASAYVRTYEKEFLDGENYRYYGSIVFGVLLSITVCLFGIGLFYGCCGKRASYYEDEGCCIRSKGASCYSCGICVSLLLLLPAMALAVLLFFAGANLQWAVCNPLQEPFVRQDALEFSQRLLDLAGDQPNQINSPMGRIAKRLRQHNATVRSILRGCDNNDTVFKVFNLRVPTGGQPGGSRYDLEKLKTMKTTAYKQLDRYLNRLIGNISVNANMDRLLTPEVEARLKQLRDDGLLGLPGRALRELKDNVDALDIGQHTGALERRVEQAGTDERDLAPLRQLLESIRAVERDNAAPLRERLKGLIYNLTAMNERLPALTENIPELLLELKHSQQLLTEDLKGQVEQVGRKVIDRLTDYVKQYVDHFETTVRTKVGSCAPLQRMAQAGTVALCDRTLNPLNGFWASALLCLLLTIPVIVLATSLHDLYTNTEAYNESPVYRRTSNGLGSTPRHGRTVSAFMTDTYDHTYRRLNGSRKNTQNRQHELRQTPTQHRSGNAWRTPSTSSSNYFDDIGGANSPPPPYPHGYHRR